MKIDDVKRILAIGAGTMGHQIGFLCAMHAYEVVIYDVNSDMLEKAKQRIDSLADKLIHIKRLPANSKDEVTGRISFTANKTEAARDIDIVTESVIEDPAIKGSVFKEFNEICPERTIFTTNTSTLIPSMFAEETGRPEKFLAFHFHDIIRTNVVDIMPHPGTSKDTVALIQAFAEKMGQAVVYLNKENIGYVFNALISALIRSALTLECNDIASYADIDRAWMGVMKTDAGPFGIIDSIGLDTVWKIVDNNAKQSNIQQLIDNAALLKNYVDAGKLGIKTGEGFYSYPEPLFKQPGFIEK